MWRLWWHQAIWAALVAGTLALVGNADDRGGHAGTYAFVLVTSLSASLAMLMIGWVLTYPHLGWRRVAIVAAAIGGIGLPLVMWLADFRFRDEESLMVAVVTGLALPAPLILLGRDLGRWIARGFGAACPPDTRPAPASPVVRRRYLSLYGGFVGLSGVLLLAAAYAAFPQYEVRPDAHALSAAITRLAAGTATAADIKFLLEADNEMRREATPGAHAAAIVGLVVSRLLLAVIVAAAIAFALSCFRRGASVRLLVIAPVASLLLLFGVVEGVNRATWWQHVLPAQRAAAKAALPIPQGQDQRAPPKPCHLPTSRGQEDIPLGPGVISTPPSRAAKIHTSLRIRIPRAPRHGPVIVGVLPGGSRAAFVLVGHRAERDSLGAAAAPSLGGRSYAGARSGQTTPGSHYHPHFTRRQRAALPAPQAQDRLHSSRICSAPDRIP